MCYHEIDKKFYNNYRILHLFNCTLRDIIWRLSDVEKAGFNVIQISPLQTNRNFLSSNWKDLYQPLGFEIGNQLGTKDELRELCEKAEALGIIIVADVVINHVANNDVEFLKPHPNVDEELLKNYSECFKPQKWIDNWNDRYQVTHWCFGLPGLNPNSKIVQRKVINMLNEYISLGVRGFRFDAAKSIALPQDYDGSNFFPNVISSLSMQLPIIYGEVLSATPELIRDYSKYMMVLTDADYFERPDIVVRACETHDSFLSDDVGYSRDWSIDYIIQCYTWLASIYPCTIFYARNYSPDWNIWHKKDDERIKNANAQLVLKKVA